MAKYHLHYNNFEGVMFGRPSEVGRTIYIDEGDIYQVISGEIDCGSYEVVRIKDEKTSLIGGKIKHCWVESRL